MDFRKTIELFLMDKTPNGRWRCTLSGWPGVAFKIPRDRIKDSESRQELSMPGVYFLFGKDEVMDRPLIYIGEAENTIVRLKQNLKAKDYWNEAIVFISADSIDSNLNKAHIKYLENSFYSIAKDCNRYSVENSKVPNKPLVTESDCEKLDEFIYYVKMMVNVLGHKVFEPYSEKLSEGEADEMFHVSVGNEKASGTPTSDGFLLLKGSRIHNESADSLASGIRKKVESSKENRQIVDGVLQEDVLFSSSSAAAAFSVGYSISGPQSWKALSGKTLKDFETETA